MLQKDEIRIRDFSLSDLKRVEELINKTVDVCYRPVMREEVIRYLKGFHNTENILKIAEQGCTIVAEKNSKMVGTGSVVDGVVLRVYIDPDFQKQGIGKRIMRELERRSIREGVEEVMLRSTAVSWKFYILLGYSIVEKNYVEVENSCHLEYYVMEKRLGERGVLSLNKRFFKELIW